MRHAGAPLGLGPVRDGEKATAVTCLVDRQRVKRLLVAALDQSRQRDVEHALERRIDEVVRALAAELKEGVAVHRRDRAGKVERDDPFAPHADEFRSAVEAHDEGVAEAVEEQAVFDHLRRHVHEHQGVLLRAIRLSGSVQHRNELAAGIENRRGATSEPGIAGEEVLLAVDDDGRPLEQARPHAVGAAVPLAPGGTRYESGARRRALEARVAMVGKQNAIAIGENDRVTRAGELLVEVRHFDVSERNKLEVLFLAGQQVLTRNHYGIRTGVGIQAIFVETAQPGTLHILRRAWALIARHTPDD